MKVISVKLDEETIELLDRYAEKYGLSRSDVIREAIRRIIKNSRALFSLHREGLVKVSPLIGALGL